MGRIKRELTISTVDGHGSEESAIMSPGRRLAYCQRFRLKRGLDYSKCADHCPTLWLENSAHEQECNLYISDLDPRHGHEFY